MRSSNQGCFPRATPTNVTVFVAIKTREKGLHGQRLPQIQGTWLQDALDCSDQVKIRFFADPQSENSADQLNKATARHIGNKDAEHKIDLESSMIPVNRCDGVDIACKTAAMFAYYLEQPEDELQEFFCNFDDDNYVLIQNLLSVLQSYQGQQNIYMGRTTFYLRGISVRVPDGEPNAGERVLVRHLTGGAGYCLSRDLVLRGRDLFPHPPPKLPDDVAVGYIVQEKLHASPIVDKRFHSHYELNIRDNMRPLSEVAKQVSFGFDNKLEPDVGPKSIPDVPILFAREQDPLLFRSLRCFLLSQGSLSFSASSVAQMHCP